jgi:hypothetical protein
MKAFSSFLQPRLQFLVVIGGFLVVTARSFVASRTQLGDLSINVLSATIFLLIANLIEDLRWLNLITWAFVVVGALSLIVRSVLPELGPPTRGCLPQMGTVLYLWLVAIVFSQVDVVRNRLHR